MFDFEWEGRPLTMTFCVIAALGSACFNVYGAFNFFAGPGGWIFAAIIAAVEATVIVMLPGIVKDWGNNHYAKAMVGAVIFALAVFGCAVSGHYAFKNLRIQVEHQNAQDSLKADRLEARAADAFVQADAQRQAGLDDDAAFGAGEAYARQAAAIRLQVAQNEPLPWSVLWALIGLLEILKAFGRWALATDTTRTWTRSQRLAHKAKSKPQKRASSDGPHLASVN